MLIYGGDMDSIDGPVTLEAWFSELKWPKLSKFYDSEWNLYYYQSDDPDGKLKVGGFYKTFENFNYMVVHSAGHLVPSTQLAASRQMLEDFLTKGSL